MQLVVDTGVTYPLLADPDSDARQRRRRCPIRGLPGIVLLDADGEVAYRNLEEIESEQQLVDLVERAPGRDPVTGPDRQRPESSSPSGCARSRRPPTRSRCTS